MNSEQEMSLVEHLTELRSRLLKSIAVILIFSIGAYVFSERLLSYLTVPVGDLVFLSPAEAFLTHIKVSVIFGILISLPIVFYQFWKFVLPALKKNEKKFFYILLPVSLLLFYAGILFCFFVVLPLGIRFLLDFGGPELEPMISLGYYISFLLALLLPFGLIFELPLVLNLMVKLRILSVERIVSVRKYVIVLIFLVGAILTPPDIITQILLAFPLIILFEASILIAKLIN